MAIQLEAASQRETLRNIREELHQVKQETNDNEKMLAEENRTQQQITTANDMINFDIEASQAMLLETITAITKAEEELRMRIDINSAKDEAINNLEQQQSLIRKELIEVTESAKLFWEEKDGLNGKLNEQRLMNRVLNDSLLLQQEQADAEKAQQILLMDSLQKELDTMEESLKEKHAILSSLQEKLLQQERIASTESENDGFAEMTKEVDEHYQPLIQSMTTKLQKLKEDNGEKAFIKIKGKIKDLELAITAKKERLAELNRVKSSNQVIETKVVLDSTGSPLKHSTTSQEPICQSITYLECKTLSKSQLLERDIITSREIERLSLSQIGEERRSSDEQDISPQKSNLRNFIRSSFLSQESYHVESIRKKSIVAEESERRRAEDERRKKRTLDPSRKVKKMTNNSIPYLLHKNIFSSYREHGFLHLLSIK